VPGLIHHVAVETRREEAEACAAFFRRLGFVAVEPPETLRDRALWLQRGPTQVHLMFSDDPVVPPAGHLAVVVDDYDAMLEHLRRAGHPVEPRPEHWGSPRAFVHDPAGHVVEIMAFPPPGPG
jgi:catechol 2,3-dioxygenase-like lactoylglutathione lyase family enzyme